MEVVLCTEPSAPAALTNTDFTLYQRASCDRLGFNLEQRSQWAQVWVCHCVKIDILSHKAPRLQSAKALTKAAGLSSVRQSGR
uniref:Uncharacterized protein n=1 Tax=Knipowitschia caucasica TaxID=637954 RepID=A0AAV2LEP7_KNICA